MDLSQRSQSSRRPNAQHNQHDNRKSIIVTIESQNNVVSRGRCRFALQQSHTCIAIVPMPLPRSMNVSFCVVSYRFVFRFFVVVRAHNVSRRTTEHRACVVCVAFVANLGDIEPSNELVDEDRIRFAVHLCGGRRSVGWGVTIDQTKRRMSIDVSNMKHANQYLIR
jgi:hypothetical protein